MNKEIFNKVKEDNYEIFNILEYLYTYGINKLEDIDTIYLNNTKNNIKLLKSYDEWNELGYRVHAGQHGIKLYKGYDYKKTYFDISQVYTIEGEEKQITKLFLKNPTIALENSKNTGFSEKYIDGIKNYISDKFSKNEKSVVEELVFTGILEGIDYYSKGKMTTKDEQRKNAINNIKNVVKSDFFDNYDNFDKIMNETAIVLRKIMVEMFTEANKKDMVENRVLDKTKNLYYTTNKDNSQYQNQNMGGSKYENNSEDEQRNAELRRREQVGGHRIKTQGNGRNTGSNENGNVENGRSRGNNGELTDLHNNGKQLSQIGNGLQATTQLYGQDDIHNVSEWNERNDKNRSMGQGNEREQENGSIDRRNQSRDDKGTLHSNASEQGEDKRDSRGKERGNEQAITGSRTNTQQVENSTNIPNELQKDDKSRISGQSEQENRNSGQEISEQLSRQEFEDIFTSEIINGTGSGENSETGVNGRNSERKSSIIENEKVEEKPSTFLLPTDLYEEWKPLPRSMNDDYNIGLMYIDAEKYFKEQHYNFDYKIQNKLFTLSDKRTDYIEFNKEIENMVNSDELNNNQKAHILEYISKQIEKGFKTEEKYSKKDENNSELNIFNYLNEDKDLTNKNGGAGEQSLASSFVANNSEEEFGKKTYEEIKDKEINDYAKVLRERENIERREELLERDYVNKEEQNDNKFNLKEKFEDNVNAIKALKKIENEKRDATKEEQQILAKYVGWGGLANYCLDETRAPKENVEIIKNLLSHNELLDAKESVNSAYFTPDYIVKEIYNKIEEFGFEGGKILEPSCGTGKFLMNMPKNIKENSNIVGIEKDSISARISKLLYPSMTIKNKGYEEERIDNGTYNLIIGNIPFGQTKLYDKEYENENLLIHDYFINKSLDKLADGGIAAIISTTGTLDKKDNKARSLFAEKANFLGAIRLPAGSFSDTKTSTDILFFQKDNKNKLGLNQDFIKSESLFNSSKDKIKSNNESYLNTITNDVYSIDSYVMPFQIMEQDMWNDLFVGIKQFEDIDPFDEDGYRYSRIKADRNKINELQIKWQNWVDNGKKENEKPLYDIKKDFFVIPQNIYLEDIEELKNMTIYTITPGIENENYYEIKETKNGDIKLKSNEKFEEKYIYNDDKNIKVYNSKNVIDNNNFVNQFFSIPINTYYKNNIDKVIGKLQTDTGRYGRPIINSELKDIEEIRKSLKDNLKDIDCKYREPLKEIEEVAEKQTYISESEYENNKFYDLKKYSHFIYNDKICFNENNKAYYVAGLKKDKEDKLKYLIKLKETTHIILSEEEKGNIEEANIKREELLNIYNEFYNKYKKRINDKEIKELIAEDDDKGLLLSLEVGTDEIIETIKTKKNSLKGSIDNYNVIGSEIINGKEVSIIEDDNGNQRFYDTEGTEYIKTQKTEFVIKEGNAGLAQIFFEPLIKVKTEIEHVDNARDGMILSLQSLGRVDIDFIEKKTGLSAEQAISDLKGLIYYDYVEDYSYVDKEYIGKWVTNDEFLSGNIIAKINKNEDLIDELQKENNVLNDEMNKKENDEEEIKRITSQITSNNIKIHDINENIETLKSVVPKKIPFEMIDISAGATWLPAKYYDKFLSDVLKVRISNWSGGTKVYLNDKISPPSFNITNKKYATSHQIETVYGTQDKTSLELFEAALNLTPISIYDTIIENGEKKQVLNSKKTGLANSKIEELKKAFVDWKENSFTIKEKQEIEKIYNEKFNCMVARKYNGDILDFPAMNQNVTLKAHQKNGIARMVFGRNAGLAHCVGSGKTYEICAGVMKFKQLGLANKSMVVVPKPLIEQWQREFLNLYPTANIIAPTEKDFSKENRARFLSKLATGNYDAIILSQEQFQKIPLSKERQVKYIKEELEKYEMYIHEVKTEGDLSDKLVRSTIKDIQREIDNLNGQLLKLNNEKNKDNAIEFEELHIDKLFVDEAHYYKNSYFATKLKRVAGIQSKMTKRTFDLQQKCKYLNEKTNYKGVYFATGTPITNSIVELYTMMKYLQDDKLNELDIKTLDDFVSAFCEIKTDFELDSTGNNYHQKTRVNTFKNVPEVIKLFKDSWDIVNVEDLTDKNIPENERLKLPTIKRDTIVLPATEMQQQLTKDFVKRSEAMQPGCAFDPKIDNHLKLTNDGKMAALDPRLYDNKLPDEKGTKTNALIDNVVKIYFDTLEEKGTQMIFSDIGVPKADKSFDIYNDIKNKLIKKGIAANEIAFIGDYDTPEKKQQMQQNMRDGKIRVLIASTDKGGTGLNVQTKMKALHHLSLPWKPSDMEQREGRIYRQGNKWDEINIYTYISQGTFDARTFEILESKSKFIKQIMQGDETIRRYEDIGKDESSINYDDWVQMALPDSNIKKMKELERDIKILEEEKNQFNYRLRESKVRIQEIPGEIDFEKKITELQLKDVERLKLEKDAPFSIKITGLKIGDVKEYDKKEIATKELHKRIFEEDKSIYYKTEYQKVAEYKGFDINVVYDATTKNFDMKAKSKETGYLYETINLSDSDIGNMTRIDNFIEKLDDKRIENHNNKIKHLQEELKDLEKSIEMKFEKETQLKEKKDTLEQLHTEEDIKKQNLINSNNNETEENITQKQ